MRISLERLKSILATAEILADEKMMAAIRRAEEDIREGRTYTSEEVRRMLGIEDAESPSGTQRRGEEVAEEWVAGGGRLIRWLRAPASWLYSCRISTLKPACWKWWSWVSTSATSCASMALIEMQSVRP